MSDTPIDTCDTSVIGTVHRPSRAASHTRGLRPVGRSLGSVAAVTDATARPPWRAVAVPSEHGGWGLTLEPALLGLLVAPSIAGGAIGVAAFLAFLVRTPLKVVLVDRHRHRSSSATDSPAASWPVELARARGDGRRRVRGAGGEWVVPFAVALPLFVVELWYDARSRSRRLVPELCGAVGIAAVVAAIALAGGEGTALAIALWIVLAARAIASVPFAGCRCCACGHAAVDGDERRR